MKKSLLIFSLLSGTAFFFPDNSAAYGILTHTHTDTPGLKPASSFIDTEKTFQIAAVCFLGIGDCDPNIGFASGGNYSIDTEKQCLNEGFVKTCPSGFCMDKSCPYNNIFGKCLTDNCPANTATTCTGAAAGKNSCGESCKKCCSDTCPSGSKSYSGSFASKTECGNSCYYCNTGCPSGRTTYTGSIVSYNECGTACRSCSNSCPAGYSLNNPGGCYDTAANECGNTCYKTKACCSDTCPSGSKSYSGSYASTTECGSTCYYCSTYCYSGSTSYSGSIITYNECGSACRRCSNNCSSGSTSSSCSSGYTANLVGSTECGNSCYICVKNDPCDGLTDKSCEFGCESNYSQCPSKCKTCKSCSNTCPAGTSLAAGSCNEGKGKWVFDSYNECGYACSRCDRCANANRQSCNGPRQHCTYSDECGCLSCLTCTCNTGNYSTSPIPGKTCNKISSDNEAYCGACYYCF